MHVIRFTQAETKQRAVDLLVGDYSFKSWVTGEMLVTEDALSVLARNDIPFIFEGAAAYEKIPSLRDSAAATV